MLQMSDRINVDLISCQEAEGQSNAFTNKPVRDPGKKTSICEAESLISDAQLIFHACKKIYFK